MKDFWIQSIKARAGSAEQAALGSSAGRDPLPGIGELGEQLQALREDLLTQAAAREHQLRRVPDERRRSAVNLVHYLALRHHDLRPLQDALTSRGLSSLGRAEPHVLASLDAVLRLMYRVEGQQWPPPGDGNPKLDIEEARAELENNATELLGVAPRNRRARIMVTAPSAASEDYMLVHRLLEAGMNCLRINSAHDDPAAWSRMIEHLRLAEKATGRHCRVLIDLAGPKLRTGALAREPAVCKVRPVRDRRGTVVRPARVWISARESPTAPGTSAEFCLQAPAEWLAECAAGDVLRFRDARRARRNLRVVECLPEGCWTELRKTAYLQSGLQLQRRREGARHGPRVDIGALPDTEVRIRLARGDVLHLVEGEDRGQAATCDEAGEVLTPARIFLPIGEVFRDARPGESVSFDDGRIGGIIEKTLPGELHIRITHTRRTLERLGSDQGINLPDTALTLGALSEDDLRHLEFIATHADMIGLSFANGVEDLRHLYEGLERIGVTAPPLVLKIETRRGFEELPAMLLEAMRFRSCGVMIARGDLAVECGFERLAEVQEEILWVCEAAHVPVIWATQVLESLAKHGHFSRAEITDAAMGQGAECVMLNKGPHVVEAVRVLDDVLQRMQGHHAKKRAMLRPLRLAEIYRA